MTSVTSVAGLYLIANIAVLAFSILQFRKDADKLLNVINFTTNIPSSQKLPHFTTCRSPEQETFSCWWSVGDYTNLTGPGMLRVFYKRSFKNTGGEWNECPDYRVGTENECYFNTTYTSIWVPYNLELRSENKDVLYDERSFNVEDIVIPDPPVNLNWTLLNTSQTGLHYDILLRWEAPPTADVAKGWITLIYEVQYRAVNDTEWKVMEHEKETYLSIYGLKTNTIYEIRIRCLQLNFDKFSRFSDIVYVYNFVPVTKESTFPVAFVLIFIVVGVAIVLMLIIFTRQHRLMMLLLPPVPIPKIKGIDPELLKKGKLDELNSILSNQQTYKTEFTNDDLWVEFIELDIDDPDEKLGHSDTHRLLSLEHLKSGKSLSMKDDDSGRASCYEPEIPEMDSLAFNVNLMEGNPEKACVLNSEGTVPNPDLSSPNATQPKAEPEKAKIESSGSEENMPVRPYPLIQTQMSNQSWANMDFYAQVSDITPAGGVLLSPGQQCKSEKTPEKEKPDEAKKYQFAMTSDSAYTSEIDAKKLSAIPTTNENDQNPEKDLSSANCISTENQSEESPYTTNETTVITMPPVSDYTSVHMVDSQHSLLLNPTAVQTKDMSMQVGYLTPDQMSSIMP
ncbi:GHR protein, partial [Polypterus senegalus]|nr:GHR protein [Polypterus senegalus]